MTVPDSEYEVRFKMLNWIVENEKCFLGLIEADVYHSTGYRKTVLNRSVIEFCFVRIHWQNAIIHMLRNIAISTY